MDARGTVVGIITTLFWLTGAAPALAQAGTLDTAFSGDGKVVTNFTPRGDFIWATALQADGKIVVAGGAGVGNGGAGTFGIARYNPDGTLDTSFGGDGKMMTNLTTRWDHAWGVAIQPDGKIVVVGASGVGGGAFSALRYNPDGTLDTSFSSDGKVITHFTTGDDWAWDVALQTDGKIVVAGVAGVSRSNKSVALVRYNMDGSLDTSFGDDGKVMRNLTPGWDDASGIEIQADGKLVTAGATGGSGGQLLVIRIEADGTPDTTFSGDGRVATNFTTRDDFAWDLALQADGKIVAAGTAGVGTGAGSFAVARYGSDGVLDTTFSGNGKVVTNMTPRADVATAVAIQADGAIVVGGEVGGSGGRFAVVRYLGA